LEGKSSPWHLCLLFSLSPHDFFNPYCDEPVSSSSFSHLPSFPCTSVRTVFFFFGGLSYFDFSPDFPRTLPSISLLIILCVCATSPFFRKNSDRMCGHPPENRPLLSFFSFSGYLCCVLAPLPPPPGCLFSPRRGPWRPP